MATQAERRASTRAVILATAADLFGTVGFADTSVADILAGSGVSRGAMYHHFPSKDDVFATVFTVTSSDAIRRASETIPAEASRLEALIAGCLGWLDVTADQSVARILLIDGPAVLGWERARRLEEATSLGVMRGAVSAAMASGEIDGGDVDLTARMINAVLSEAALTVQSAPRRQRQAAAKVVTSMIHGLTQR